jgi:hypothetical protein
MGKQNFDMLDKSIRLEISNRAQTELDKRDNPLHVEMELYFSCLIRKQLRFREELDERFAVNVSDALVVGFRPVMTKACSIASCDDGKPPLSDFPIKKPESYIPKWLKLDFKKGEWCGDFGY